MAAEEEADFLSQSIAVSSFDHARLAEMGLKQTSRGHEDLRAVGLVTPPRAAHARSASLHRETRLMRSFCFGTPSHPSPLDRIRGREMSMENLDLNTTYPATAPSTPPAEAARPGSSKLANVRGVGMLTGRAYDSVSFSRPEPRGAPPDLSTSFANILSASIMVTSEPRAGAMMRNPNKALLTVGPSSEILIVNEVACALFACQASQLVGVKFTTLIRREGPLRRAEEASVAAGGSGVERMSGRVMDVQRPDGSSVAASVWVRRVEGDGKESERFIAVLEEVARTEATAVVDKAGLVVGADATFVALYGREGLIGSSISAALPGVRGPADLLGQEMNVASQTTSGGVLPVNVTVQLPSQSHAHLAPEGVAAFVYVVSAYANISGLLTVVPDGTVYACSELFAAQLFGLSEVHMVRRPITDFLPELRVEGGLPEGVFRGTARHRDGSMVAVSYQIKRIEVDADEDLYCVWVTRTGDVAAPSTPSSAELVAPELPDIGPHAEAFLAKYECLRQIGKGSFGFVWLARATSTHEPVVVKFISKHRVLAECWEPRPASVPLPVVAEDPCEGYVPREIQILTSVKHPSIVHVTDVMHSTPYFQMVMAQHGPGLDLFEFIENHPDIDESVASTIFRQMVSAVEFLHSRSIVHRDIKDENVVLDLDFRARLIDFGSAAYMKPGKLFDTFCGTIEYCAPEVLRGNPYPGPELEVFSTGVTLYTLLYAENPFFDVEETIAGVLRPPFALSPPCADLLSRLLDNNPRTRITITEAAAHPWLVEDVSARVAEFARAFRAEYQQRGGKSGEDTEDEHGEIYDHLLHQG